MANGRRERGIILDTHVWIWAVEQDLQLDETHKALIEAYSDRAFICAASLWEVSMLVSKKRFIPKYPLQDWFDFATSAVGLPVLPLTANVAREAYELPGKFHEDPANRMIVATARTHDFLLLSEDAKIKKYSHVRVS